MSHNPETFKQVANIIVEACNNIERDRITPISNLVSDLGLDSLDFLYITIDIEKTFKIKIPPEQLPQQRTSDTHYTMGWLCNLIDTLVEIESG